MFIDNEYINTDASNGKKKHRLYSIWSGMKNRCFNIKHKSYECYGGRGITICNNWLKFEEFYRWSKSNGYQDSLTIDRIDTNGNYCPENCRWITQDKQKGSIRPRKNTTSKYKGVMWDKVNNQWYACIASGKNKIHLGRFNFEVDAAIAYNIAAIEYFGKEYVLLNKIPKIKKLTYICIPEKITNIEIKNFESIDFLDKNSVLEDESLCNKMFSLFRRNFHSLNKFVSTICAMKYLCLVINNNTNKIEGMAIVSGAMNWQIDYVCVSAKSRNKGLASDIVKYIINKGREKNIPYIMLTSREELRHLYQDKCYFTVIDES